MSSSDSATETEIAYAMEPSPPSSSSQERQFGIQNTQRVRDTMYPQYPVYVQPMAQTYLYVNTATTQMFDIDSAVCLSVLGFNTWLWLQEL